MINVHRYLIFIILVTNVLWSNKEKCLKFISPKSFNEKLCGSNTWLGETLDQKLDYTLSYEIKNKADEFIDKSKLTMINNETKLSYATLNFIDLMEDINFLIKKSRAGKLSPKNKELLLDTLMMLAHNNKLDIGIKKINIINPQRDRHNKNVELFTQVQENCRKNPKEKLVYQLLEEANDDYELCQELLKQGRFSTAIGLHSHQAVEKYLKAVLVFYQIELPKTHDLLLLLDLISKKNDSLASELSGIKYLIPYGVESRYGEELPEITLKDARVAFSHVQKVKNAVSGLLKLK